MSDAYWRGVTGSTSTGTTSTYVRMPTYTQQPRDENPLVQGSGPITCSTSRAIAKRPLMVWDVNGYYRAFGIDFPYRPTRKEIRAGWLKADPGAGRGMPTDERLIYIFKQLLDPVIRAAYDECPFGSRFLDKYVEAEIRRKAIDEAQRRMMAEGLDMTEDVVERYQSKVYEEMGVEFDDTPEDAIDNDPLELEDPKRPAKFEYAFYIWRLGRPGTDQESRAVAEWQTLIVKALADRGEENLQIAVGLFSRTQHRFVLAKIGQQRLNVFFLNVSEFPSVSLAEMAVDQWLRENHAALPSQESR